MDALGNTPQSKVAPPPDYEHVSCDVVDDAVMECDDEKCPATHVFKSSPKYYCTDCDYFTSKKSNYDKHLLTTKHIQATQANDQSSHQLAQTIYTCANCSKLYNSRPGLWRHRKYCAQTATPITATALADNSESKLLTLAIALMQEANESNKKKDELVQQTIESNKKKDELVQQTIEFMKEMMKQNANNSHNTISNNNIANHSHNKTFNLQFFLNDTCRNAMNMSEFVNMIQPQLADLEEVGVKGYVDGVSKIILNGFNSVQEQERPLHCSDSKREVFYIKENNEWTKEAGDEKPILTKAIKTIAQKNIRNIMKWASEHPGCNKSDSRLNNQYLNIVSNSMNGLTEEESIKNINKIISNVAKKVVINKSAMQLV